MQHNDSQSSSSFSGSNLNITPEEWAKIAQRLDLSERQVQVAEVFIRGGSKKPEAIAQMLDVEISTVKKHIERLYQNIGAHDRADVVVRVLTELIEIRKPGTNETRDGCP